MARFVETIDLEIPCEEAFDALAVVIDRDLSPDHAHAFLGLAEYLDNETVAQREQVFAAGRFSH